MATSIENVKKYWFSDEISLMLCGFCGSASSNLDTSYTIEMITLYALHNLFCQALNIPDVASFSVDVENFIFLLRKQKLKLSRILHYAIFKDTCIRNVAVKSISFDADNSTELEGNVAPDFGRRTTLCQNYLSFIESGAAFRRLLHDSNFADPVKMSRIIRSELLSRQLDSDQYLHYSEARQASFAPKCRTKKLKDWICMKHCETLKFHPYALELLSRLAYEFVGELVDLCHIIAGDKIWLNCLTPASSNLIDCNNDHLGLVSSQTSTGQHEISASEYKRSTSDILRSIRSRSVMEASRRASQPIGPFLAFKRNRTRYTRRQLSLFHL